MIIHVTHNQTMGHCQFQVRDSDFKQKILSKIINSKKKSFISRLDECNTTAVHQNDSIIFMNTVKIYERIHPMGLQMNNDVEIDLECAFDESFEGLVLTIFVAIVSYFLKFTHYANFEF